MGKEVVRILYERHARVYMTARSQEKAQRARTDIIATVPFSEGELITVLLDLGDLNTVRSAANEITQREKEIQVLFNNAGIGIATAEAQTTEQGFDRWLGVNNVAPHLFTKLLAPALREAAKVEKPGAVRVVWVSSISGVLPDVPSGGVPLHHIAGNRDDVELEKYQKKYGIETRYGISRAGNILQAAQFARFFDRDGVTSIAMHPGVIETESFTPIAEKNTLAWIFKILFMQPAIYGARTQVFAGLSPEITMGSYLGKWGM
jgi:NAD(P)-dependent dehydrogenase (short-subunit alcohol dehydrogenase family)